jgi:hypothetical protein
MRLFKIYNPKFKGEIEVLYSQEQLLKIDFGNALQIKQEDITSFKRVVPASIEEFLKQTWCGNTTTIVESNYDIPLEDFTREYPYQRNTHLLPPIWGKMPITDRYIAVTNARAYRLYCERNKWYNPKIAASWLKNKEYLNDWNKM